MSAPDAAAAGERLSAGARRIGGLTMLSRVLGLVRELMLGHLFGAGPLTDAYVAAFRIPNLLRDLFAEGALSQSFVPTFIRVQKERGKEAAFALANRVQTTLVAYLGALTAIVMLWPGLIVHLLAPGFSPEMERFTGDLVRVMMPFLPIICVAVAAMGVLNAERRYTAPALSSSMFNVVAIVGGVGLHLAGVPDRQAIIGWAWLTLLGGFAQLFIQVPPLRGLGFRFRIVPDLLLKDPAARTIAKMMGPAALAVAAVQINVVINTQFASRLEPGTVTWLNFAFRLMQLPIGVFGVAVGTVSVTELARGAAAGDRQAIADTVRRGLRLVWFLTVPSTLGLALLAEPIVAMIFQHGDFDARDTHETARALVGYSVGLAAYSAIKVIAPVFYAVGRPRLPLYASVSGVLFNFVWNLATYRTLTHLGLALGTSIAATVNLAVLAVAARGVTGPLVDRAFAGGVFRILLAAGVMAGTLLGLRQLPLASLAPGFVGRAIAAFIPIALGAGVYFAVAAALRLPEARALVRRLRR